MNNIYGIIVSLIFICIVIGLSSILTKKQIISGEGSRKFIHIGVSNWWIIAMLFFDNRYYAIIVPAMFVIINYISYKFKVIKAMERNNEKNDLGTVYYAISLLILSFLTLDGSNLSYIGAIGVLTMGYGDGLAAVVGTFKGKKYISIGRSLKSKEGTITMFIATFIVTFIIITVNNIVSIPWGILIALLLAVIGTLLELFTSYGLDNITVPLGVSLVYYLITLFL